jgi:ABC-type transport system involved in multi-copper enzyme maturation permease subunit
VFGASVLVAVLTTVVGSASAGELLGAIALVMCAGTLAADYSQGTWRNLLVRQPGRLRLLAGKWLALLGLVGAAGLVATVAAVVAALVVAPSQGIDTADWTNSSAPRC